MIGLLGHAGCGGPAGPTTYPVKGQVQLADGEVKVLAGHNLEAALEADSTVRAYGLIHDDGSFELETLRAGVLQSGAAEGKYRVRVALSDDDPDARSRFAQAVHPRFLTFDASGCPSRCPRTLRLPCNCLRSDWTRRVAAPLGPDAGFWYESWPGGTA